MQAIVCGLGSMGRRRIRILKNRFPHVQIFAVDPDRERTRAVEQDVYSTGYDFFETFNAVKPEVVFVCSPPASHSDFVIFALENGAHTFSELNLVAQKYDEIIKAAASSGKKAFLSSTFLYNREIIWIADMARHDSGLSYRYHTGQYLPDWHPWEDYRSFFVSEKETNALREIMAIEFPWIFKAFGRVTDYRCMARRLSQLDIDYPDTLHMILNHENGNMGSISFDCVSIRPVRHLEVYNDRCFFTWEGRPGTLTRYSDKKKAQVPVRVYDDIIDDEDYAEFIFDNPYEEEIQTFFAMIEKENICPAHDYKQDRIIISFIDRIEAQYE